MSRPSLAKPAAAFPCLLKPTVPWYPRVAAAFAPGFPARRSILIEFVRLAAAHDALARRRAERQHAG